jgi:hypothetical protein
LAHNPKGGGKMVALAVGLVVLMAAAACGEPSMPGESGMPGASGHGDGLPHDDSVAESTGPPVTGAATLLESILSGGDPRQLDDFRQLLRRDSIEPIYDPQFVRPAESGLEPDDLVMGVSINGDSRAYPIRYLQWREMVNDEVGGIPILVTW